MPRRARICPFTSEGLDLFLLQQPLFQNFSDIAGAVNDTKDKNVRVSNLVNDPKFVLDDLTVFKVRGS